MPALFISVMRTGVPLVAGWLLTLAVKAGVTIDSDAVTYAVTVALVLVYYVAFRLLEVLGTRLRGTALQKFAGRSEERRVGKECRSRWSPYH